MKINLIFPNQLFQESDLISNGNRTYLIEEYLFFKQYAFHKQKLAFHRASMQSYFHYLQNKGIECIYVDCNNEASDVRKFNTLFSATATLSICTYEPHDDWLRKRISSLIGVDNIEWYTNPMFLTSQSVLDDFFGKEKSFYFQTTFYKQQRKRLSILMSNDNKPEGGKWSFDVENRKTYPKGKTPPDIQYPSSSQEWKEATAYIQNNFAENLGELTDYPLYPTTFQQAKSWLNQFLQDRFHEFGAYEDAIVVDCSILHHSVLSPLLNTGLLLPEQILERSLGYAKQNEVPINSVEGFVRQIIGWREFVNGVYLSKGREERTKNALRFTRHIPQSFYKATTGIPPIDSTIQQVLKTGYCHHIERLMILGNFMLLCEFNPNDVYQWFMELFIDAYDWVMVPNVYGMSQFSDGGLFATKPYISSSNYLRKMSNFPKGEWEKVWDGLYWRFIDKHRHLFLSNPRSSMMVSMFDKMIDEKKESLRTNAEQFLKQLK